MDKFYFNATEIIDDNFIVKMIIEPHGSRFYQYKLMFDDGKNITEFNGLTSEPLSAVIKLRNVLISTIDTLSDCIDIVKIAGTHIGMSSKNNLDVIVNQEYSESPDEYDNTADEDENNEEEDEDDDKNQSGI